MKWKYFPRLAVGEEISAGKSHSALVAVCAQLYQTLCDPTSRLFCQWDSPGKNTGVGYQTLLRGIFGPSYQTQTHVSYVSCIGRRVLYQ